MSWRVMPSFDSYDEARASFEWNLPAAYNPALDFVRNHENPDAAALVSDHPSGETRVDSFRDIDQRSDRLAAALSNLGIGAGDRVGVVIPQRPENPVTHLANWKLGAVSVPLTVLFGRDALRYRLRDSEARAVVVDPSVRGTVDEIRDDCPALEHVVELGEQVDSGAHAFDALVDEQPTGIDIYESTPETPSAIMYTSGSTGPPKGVLHSHALWLGRAAAASNYFDQGLHDATLWTPADWAWGAALGGTLFAAWHHGCSIVGWPREEFDPGAAFDLMARHDVTHAFMPPTALRLLMSVDNPPTEDLSLSTFASAGEPMTPEIVEWVAETFEDVAVNEFYGQTELNLVVGNCSNWFETRPESMGKPLPGYEVAILDTETREQLPPGETGEIAVRPGDRRVFFDEYWGLPEKTAAKVTDDGWFLTGDLARRDEDGYLWFVSRKDDIILTRGYRVGPMEVESAILEHDAVEQAGVVGIPDETTGEAIKAYVQPSSAAVATDELRAEIRTLVRDRLAEYEYPEYIEFVDSLPTTTTGKIQRESLRDRE